MDRTQPFITANEDDMPFLLIIVITLTASACSSKLLYEMGQPHPSTCNRLLQAEREECLNAQESRMDYEEYEAMRKKVEGSKSK